MLINLDHLNEYLLYSKLGSILMNNYTRENIVEIPSEYYFKDIEINSINDILHIFQSIQFWDSYNLPTEIYDFIHNNKTLDYENELFNILLNDYTREIDRKFINNMKLIYYSNFYNLMDRCSSLGNMDIMFWAFKQGYPFTKNTINNACMNGNYHCLIFAHKHGAIIQEESCLYSVLHECDDFLCVKYCYENGSNIDTTIFNLICLRDYSNCLTYLLSLDLDVDFVKLYKITKQKNSTKCMKILKKIYNKIISEKGKQLLLTNNS